MLKNQLLKSCALVLLLGPFSWGAHAVRDVHDNGYTSISRSHASIEDSDDLTEDELNETNAVIQKSVFLNSIFGKNVKDILLKHSSPEERQKEKISSQSTTQKEISSISDEAENVRSAQVISFKSIFNQMAPDNPIKKTILEYLGDKDIGNLFLTSRSMKDAIGNDVLDRAKKTVLLENARDEQLGYEERLAAAKALPINERNEILLDWVTHKGDINLRLGAAEALPLENKKRNQFLNMWAGNRNLEPPLRRRAVEALPSDRRNEILRDWVQDPKSTFPERIIGAELLPPENAERNQMLRGLTRDSSLKIPQRLRAAKALPNGPEKEAILQDLRALQKK